MSPSLSRKKQLKRTLFFKANDASGRDARIGRKENHACHGEIIGLVSLTLERDLKYPISKT